MLCLLSNAVKFGMDVTVEVRCFKTAENELKFEVEDSGIGISEENRINLFHPFQQAQRSAGGAGLGLYSLSKRIECMRGHCGIRNRNDNQQGCCFWFTIPYSPDNTIEVDQEHSLTSLAQRKVDKFGSSNKVHPMVSLSPRATSYTERTSSLMSRKSSCDVTTETSSHDEESPRPRRVIAERSKVSVLLVDDAIVIQKTIGGALRRRNFDVTLASNGLMGLNLMKEKQFDLVLMDLQMPIMDGHESVKRLRMFEKESNVCPENRQVVIAISANADEDTIAQTSVSGMDYFVAKPFSMDKLIQVCVGLKVRAFASSDESNGDSSDQEWRAAAPKRVLSERSLKSLYVITPHV